MKSSNMSNEIVSLRQSVRQARVCVINKLIRKAKVLRASHGNEKQVEKNKIKADKLLREVFALKRIKNDQISTFGIANFDNLSSILQDPNVDDESRAMAKIVCYKSLSSKIMEFQKRYPEYGKCVLRKKKDDPNKKVSNAVPLQEKDRKVYHSNLKAVEENKGNKLDTPCAVRAPCEQKKDTIEARVNLMEISTNIISEEEVKNVGERKKIPDVNIEIKNSPASEVTKIVSKQALVERFTKILEQKDAKFEEERETRDKDKGKRFSNETLESEVGGDKFFIRASGVTPSSSVAISSAESSIIMPNRSSTSSFKSFGTRSNKTQMNYERIKEKVGDVKRCKNNNKDVSQNVGNQKKKNLLYCKQEKKYGKDKEGKVVGSVHDTKNESLHPSWAAKRKQQDIMKQSFQGKKIKFDTD